MHRRLPAAALRWRCDPAWVPVESTAELAHGPRVPGQALAVEALRFGIECRAPSQNVLVRGRSDAGGMELVLDLLRAAGPPCAPRPDVAYVRNFRDPWRPRFLLLPAGSGGEFQRRVRELGSRLRDRDVESAARAIADQFCGPGIAHYLEDALAYASVERSPKELRLAFEVNVVTSGVREGAHVLRESYPTEENLVGTAGPARRDGSDAHLAVQAGSLLRADGGFLVVDASDLDAADGAGGARAVRALVRSLRGDCVEPASSRARGGARGGRVRPEPAPVAVRVVLVGEPWVCDGLTGSDPAFADLFKVTADIDDTMERTPESARVYAHFVGRLARDEGLLPFHRSAVLALLEHGARIGERTERVTARLWRIADIAREAEFLARSSGRDATRGLDVEEAVRRTKRRGSLGATTFQTFVADGGLLVRVDGDEVGQVNGLSVIEAGPLTYGIPTRITASVAPGSNGIIDVERAAQLSGAIHVKGFQILEGLLRSLLLRDHMLAFGASLAFEQTYGRVDGDSAAAAEVCCLLSALTGVPIRQGLAITGSVDQLGQIQAVGGVNEKVEGFFDTCRTLGSAEGQGVIIPASNAGDLMLREDVVQACDAGRFDVWTVETIHDAIELLTGMRAGVSQEDGTYPEDTLLRLAVERSESFWRHLSVVGAGHATEVGSGLRAAEDAPAPEEEQDSSA